MAATGAYIAQADIEAVFGTTNIALWSNLDNTTTTADTARIQAAIDYAEGYVEDRLRPSRYAVPFSGSVPKQVIDWIAKVAGVWLYEARGSERDSSTSSDDDTNRIRFHKRDVDRAIDAVLAGVVGIGLVETITGPTAPTMVV